MQPTSSDLEVLAGAMSNLGVVVEYAEIEVNGTRFVVQWDDDKSEHVLLEFGADE